MQPPIRDEATKEIAANPIIVPKDGVPQGSNDGRPMGSGPGMEMGGMGHGGGGAAPVSLSTLRNLNTFASFKNRVFLLYYGAMAGQMAAMNMEMLARSLLVYDMTGSGTILGVMTLAASLPQLFFSLFGGVLADRVQKKYVLIGGMLGSAAITGGIGLFLAIGFIGVEQPNRWWVLVVAAFVKGTFQGIMMPSRQAIIPEIVGREQLMNAVALGNLEMNINRLVMPAISGFIIELFGYEAAYFFMTAMYLVAATFAFLMPRTGTMSLRGRGALVDIKEGLVYVRHEATLLIILGVTFVVVFLSMPYSQLLPVFTKDIFKVGAGGMGVLLSVSGVGALVASLVFASLPNKRRGVMFLWGSLLLGLALVGFSFSSYWFPSQAWPLALGFIVVVGIGQTARMTLANALLQYYVQDEYRGRVMALYMMDFGLTSLGVFIAGIMSDEIGVRATIGGMAAMLAVFCVFAIAFIPRLRKLD
ncbi:MAG: MFS transporter [Chloroflexi bacterium]|nr:MFS transporter [Chloroflexota bacterium]